MRSAALARRLGLRLHTHLAETAEENRYCQEVLGCRPLDYLEQCGWLDAPVWVAHGIHFAPAEIARLARLCVAHGVEKIRLTGGEPLVRRDLEQLVALLAQIDGLADLTHARGVVPDLGHVADVIEDLCLPVRELIGQFGCHLRSVFSRRIGAANPC